MIAPAHFSQPRDGSQLYRKLIDAYASSREISLSMDNRHEKGYESNGLLRDLIHSATTRAAAVYYSVYGLGQDERPSFMQVKDALAEAFPDLDEAQHRQIFFNTIKSKTKTITYTPHPTEVLSPEAILAEEAFMNLLLSPEGEKFLNGSESLDALLSNKATAEKLFNAIDALRTTLDKYPEGPLYIKDETERSLQMAKRGYDAAPIMASRAAIAAYGDRESGQRLSLDELLAFEDMISLQTWSPGDQDNKWQSRAHYIRDGVTASKIAIKHQYIKSLLSLHDELQSSGSPDKQDAIDAVKRIISGIERTSGGRTQWLKIIEGMHNNSVLEELRESPTHDNNAYASFDSLKQDLIQLREKHNHLFASQKDPFGQETPLTTLDSFIVQALNFKEHMLKIQIRQNQEDIGGVHTQDGNDDRAGAMDVIKKYLLREEFITQDIANDPHKLVNAIYNDINIAKALQDFLQQLGKQKIYTRLEDKDGKALQEEYEENPYFSLNINDPRITAPDQDGPYGISLQEKFVAYHIMKTMQVAVENPAAVPNFIIAESNKPEDVLNTLFIAKAMLKPSEGVDYTTQHPKIEIYPLFEHYPDIMAAPKTMEAVFSNPHYVAQQQSLSKKVMICDPINGDPTNGWMRPKTAADRKLEMGLTPEPGDEKKELSYKRIMFAGSDSFKGGSVFIEPLLDEIKFKLEQQLLSQGYEAYYEEGAGNAVYRKQPVNAPDETVQGNGMRWHPIEAAVRATRQIAETILNKVGMLLGKKAEISGTLGKFTERVKQQAEEQKYYQVNRSRMEHLRNQDDGGPELWAELQERCDKGSLHYQELYKNEAYTSMLTLASGSAFAKLISFAARSAARQRAVGASDTGYPPYTDVEAQRAIGYGMSLMNTAHQLYYGMEAFATNGQGTLTEETVEANAKRVAEIYNRCPNLQNVINRATYGVMMADMKTAWKFADLDIERKDNGIVNISGTDLKIVDIAAYARALDANADISAFADVSSVLNKSNQPNTDQRDALLCLAKIDYEHQKAEMLLKAVYKELFPEKAAATELADMIPKAVANEIENIRANIGPSRERLAVIHQELKDGKREMPGKGGLANQEKTFLTHGHAPAEYDNNGHIIRGKEGPLKTYEDIYFNMAQVQNGMEYPLSSMIYPEHGAAVDKARNRDGAALAVA